MDLWLPAPGSLFLAHAAPWVMALQAFSEILEVVSALLPGMGTSLCTQLEWQFPAIMEGNYLRIWFALQP